MTPTRVQFVVAIYFFLAVVFCRIANAQTATINVDFNTILETSGQSKFDRRKFINVHSSLFDADWKNNQEKLRYIANDLDVYFGRDTGEVSWMLSQMREDSKRPGFVEFNLLQDYCQNLQLQHVGRQELRAFIDHEDPVAAAQPISIWPKCTTIAPPDLSTPWKIGSPEAAGEYIAYWLNMARSIEGAPRPRFVELLNEPLYEIERGGIKATAQEVFEFHRRAATQLRAYCPDAKWGGYTCAFPDIETDDFKNWEQTWKQFIDIVGDDIDFYSLHLYDFPGVNFGQQMFRKGCQLEATLDTIEHYSALKFGKPKPFLISEYGSQLHDWYKQPWSSQRDWLCIKAINSMMMQFMGRHDQIVKAVPFVPGLAEWGFDQKQKLPYHWRLLKRANEPADYSGDVVFTDQIKLYEFWKHVHGSRVPTSSSDDQLLTESYVDGHQAFLIINNLGTEPVTLDVPTLQRGIKPTKVFVRHLYFHESKVQLDGRYFEAGSKSLVVGPEASLLLICDFEKPLEPSRRVREQKHFATTQFSEIVKSVSTEYTIQGVKVHKDGSGTLRIAIGRDHGLAL